MCAFLFHRNEREGGEEGGSKNEWRGFLHRYTGIKIFKKKKKKGFFLKKTDIPEPLLLWPRMNQTLYISVTGLSRVILAPLMHLLDFFSIMGVLGKGFYSIFPFANRLS